MVIGTRFGAISPGITLCGGIVAYCRAWKHQDDDVASLAALCEAVSELLKAIAHRVQIFPILDAKLVGNLNNTHQAYTSHCEAAIRLSNKYNPPLPTSAWKEKARVVLKKN
jgi:hypothetical protein